MLYVQLILMLISSVSLCLADWGPTQLPLSTPQVLLNIPKQGDSSLITGIDVDDGGIKSTLKRPSTEEQNVDKALIEKYKKLKIIMNKTSIPNQGVAAVENTPGVGTTDENSLDTSSSQPFEALSARMDQVINDIKNNDKLMLDRASREDLSPTAKLTPLTAYPDRKPIEDNPSHLLIDDDEDDNPKIRPQSISRKSLKNDEDELHDAPFG